MTILSSPHPQTLIADIVANAAHDAQFRNGGKKVPYITHPRALRPIARRIYEAYKSYIGDINLDFLDQVCLLHDVVEDTDTTLEDLRSQGFDEVVISAVAAITKHPVKGAESYVVYLKRVYNNTYARIVKLADLTHNMSDLAPSNMKDKYELAYEFLSFKSP